MKNKPLKSPAVFFIISAIFFIHLFFNIFWLRNNPEIGGEDVPSHLFNNLTITSQLNQAIAKHDIFSIFYQLNSGAIRNDFGQNYGWPRLVYFISAVFNLIFGTSFFVTIMSNMFWFLILMISVYLIGFYLADEKTGLFAVILTSFSPFIWGMSRKYGLDFPLIAMVSLSIYFLIKTERFSNRLYTMLFFSALGIGFNVKMQILIFLIVPVFINIFGEKFIIKKAKNIALGFMVFFILSSLFWLGCFKKIVYLFFMQQTTGFNDSALANQSALVPSLIFYLHYLLIGLGFTAILFILGVYKILKVPQKNMLLVLSWAVIPIVLFSVIDPKHGRYILPAFPGFCLIASSGVMYFKNKTLKNFLIGLYLGIYMVIYFAITFGLIEHYNTERNKFWFIGLNEDIHTLPRYNLDDVGKKFTVIIRNYMNKNKTCKIGILEHSPCFIKDSPLILLCYMKLELPDNFLFMEKDVLMTSKISNIKFIQELSSFNFLIISTEDKNSAIDYKNILNSDFWRSRILSDKDQCVVKKYLSEFEVISKEEAYMGQENFILNLLIHKN